MIRQRGDKSNTGKDSREAQAWDLSFFNVIRVRVKDIVSSVSLSNIMSNFFEFLNFFIFYGIVVGGSE